MKKTLAFIVLVALIVNCVSIPRYSVAYTTSEQIVISERVGKVIDAEEREYFNLFLPEIYLRPTTYRYESATLRAIDGGGYELRIAVTTGTLVVVNKDPEGIEILTDYIDNYEEIKESKEMFVEKWGIVDYDFLGLPITKYEVQLVKISENAVKKGVSPKKTGMVIGGCVGGLLAYGIIKKAGWGSRHDIADPGIEGAFAFIDYFYILATALGGLTAGMLVGYLAGSIVGNGRSKPVKSDIDEADILGSIKEARKPRVE